AIASVTNPITRANQSSVHVSGTAERGAKVHVFLSDPTLRNGVSNDTIATDAGTWALILPVSTIPDGVINVQADATDAAGNTGAVGTTTTTKNTAVGYWLVGADGKVYPHGSAASAGQLPTAPNKPVVGSTPTPDGGGYWLVA